MHLRDIQLYQAAYTKEYFPHLKEGPLYLGVALAGEVGEVCNKIKKWARDYWDTEQLRNEIKEELADILIYLVLMSANMNIDLEEEYHKKKEYNDERWLGTADTRLPPASS